MFADEHPGAARRKKAQEQKERRLRLKQEREKKQQQQAKGTSSTAPTPSSSQPSSASIPSSSVSPSPTIISAGSAPKSAVQRAAEQREIRAHLASQHQAARLIQSQFRTLRQRLKSLQLLQSKLNDLETLRNVLQKKTLYVPPANTVLSLVRQFLLLHQSSRTTTTTTTTTRSYCSDCSQVFKSLLKTALVPGLVANKSPLVEWVTTRMGQIRLRRLLGYALYFTCQLRNNAGVEFLKLLLVESTQASLPLTAYCRSLLLIDSPPPSSSTTTNSLDLVARVRKDLLTMTSKPIPIDAQDKRGAVFTAGLKEHASLVVDLLLKLVGNDLHLQGRFVKDILVVPLLTWRVNRSFLDTLVSSSKKAEPLVITLLRSFTVVFAEKINQERLESLLEASDLNMAVCGATGTQILLANLLQLGRLIPSCNGTVATRNDFDAAALFFNVVAAVVHVVPVGTFLSERESSIAWIAGDNNNPKAIVLSPLILEQCRSLLVDAYVRRVVLSSIDTSCLRTEAVLANKNDVDRKDEMELQAIESSSAASLAAKEARLGQSNKFWNTSGWAKKLARNVTKFLPKDSGGLPKQSETVIKQRSNEGQLLNTTSVSRQLAEGSQQATEASQSPKKLSTDEYSACLLYAFVRLFAIVVARWGGGGNTDIVSGETKASKGCDSRVTAAPDPCVKALLNVLCFSTPFVRVAWGLIQSESAIVSDVHDVIDRDKGRNSIRALTIQPLFEEEDRSQQNKTGAGAPLLFLFLCAFSHVLIVTDDAEIHTMDRPIPINHIRRCIRVLKKLLYRATCVEGDDAKRTERLEYFGLALVSAAARAMRDLYDRSSRRPICVPSLWIVEGLLDSEIGRCKSFKDYQSLISTSVVLRVCPYMVSFKRRLKLFDRIISTNRVEIQGENSANPFHNNPLKPGIPVRITRGRLLEDGLATMNSLGRNMRQRISVLYYNEAGTRESGIDAGGLFKEFWTDLCAIAFDPNYALFKVTDSVDEGNAAGIGNCLYPNPSSGAAHGSDHVTLFAFLGRILGKAMYEGITIPPVFAHFFLSFLKGDYNFLHMLPDLSTMDPQLYNNLMFLKTYDGDASDLCLTFTVTVNAFGGTREIPLVQNGGSLEVNNGNKHHYIQLVAKYYVYDRIREQSEAMIRGLFEVVDPQWLRIFNEPELQVVISGANDGKIDVDDMRAHCQYEGGFSGIDITVNRFWKVVASLDHKQQGALLRFVTSCERPPPLGFKSLNPPFTIRRVGIFRDGHKLPTASTCFNVLKLPTYSSEKVMRQRLVYAIESGAGFELT